MEARLEWVKDMNFRAYNRDLTLELDATHDHGGQNLGPSPKELVLDAMLGCTAMDVVSMLKKMRQPIEKFNMKIEVEKNLEHPVYFKTAILNFYLFGEIDPAKLTKSVTASLTKYCGVNYMISKTCAISYKVFLNDTLMMEDKVNFQDPKS